MTLLQHLTLWTCAVLLVLVSLFYTNIDKRRWRQCVKCWRWWSNSGDRSDVHPRSLHIDDPGICPDCTNDVRFNRE